MPTGKVSNSVKAPPPLAARSAAARVCGATAARWRLRGRRKSAARAATARATALTGTAALAEATPARVTTLRKAAWSRWVIGVASTAVWRVCHRHRAARTRRDVEREQPLVVSRGAPVRTDRRLLALAANPRNPASTASRLQRRVASAGRLNRAGRLKSAGLTRSRLSGAGLLLSARDARCLGAEAERQELAVLRHRVLVFLAQESVLDQKVDAWRERVRDVLVLELEKGDRSRVLLAAKHELGFLFALRLVAPDRHQDRQQNSHDREGHQKGCHRVSALTVLTA
jgi:hypothetical protein